MKKTKILGMLLAVCVVSGLAGCGGNKEAKNEDKAGTAVETKAETGAEAKAETEAETEAEGSGCEYDCPGAGFGFDLPEGVEFTNGFLGILDMGDMDYDSGVMMGWPVYYDMSEEEYDELTVENIDRLHTGFSFQIACVEGVSSEEEAKKKMIAVMDSAVGPSSEEDLAVMNAMKMIHQEDGRIWLAYRNERQENVREDCREEYNAYYDAADQIIAGMKFYEPQVWKGAEEGTALSFETTDLDGNPVNSKALFAKNKVTMINIWATTCGPCIDEMPELEALNRELKEKGGAIVGIVDDVRVDNKKYLDEAKDIVSDTGVTYQNLCAWEGYEDILSHVGTPTTYFVDSRGELIGDPILGANLRVYREKMEEFLSQAK